MKGSWNLTIPKEVNDEVSKLSKKHGWALLEGYKKVLKLGLSGFAVIDDPASDLIVRTKDGDSVVVP